MRVIPTRLTGPKLLEPLVHRDGRGFLLETSRADELAALDIGDTFVQENQSRSIRGTVRGLHYQAGNGQAKLVRVARGEILDVVVDIRLLSATFGQWEAATLDDITHRALYVPVGFAHGFCVLSDEADVLYRVSSYYNPDLEHGLAWDDPDLNVAWPISEPILSPRDRANPRLRDLELP